LENAKWIEEILDCRDANIAGVTGLDPDIVERLLSKGAVSIPDASSWIAYKEAGCPHERWREFAAVPPKVTR
jgi:hypothetical protein